MQVFLGMEGNRKHRYFS